MIPLTVTTGAAVGFSVIARSAGLRLPLSLSSPGPVEMMRLQTRDEEYHMIYFFGTHGAPAGRGFDRKPQHWSTLLLSLPQGWNLAHRPGRRGSPFAQASTLYSQYLFVDIGSAEIKLSHANKEVPAKGRKGNNCSKKPLCLVSEDYGKDPQRSGSTSYAQFHYRPRCFNRCQKSSRE